MNETINWILVVIVGLAASISLAFWLSPTGLRNIANYCLARAAGLDAYDRTYRQKARRKTTPTATRRKVQNEIIGEYGSAGDSI